MKKIILLLVLISTFAFSAIDECKTDIYFGNGILTKKWEAKKNATEVLKPAIIEKFGTNYYNKHVGKVSYAYNESHGKGLDALESALQKFDWDLLLSIISPSHGRDIDRQVGKYKNSIMKGNKVLVVAHSQGNLFAQDAYVRLDGWMQNYFEAVSIASPMTADIKYGTTTRI